MTGWRYIRHLFMRPDSRALVGGFTLLEGILVVAILIILAAVAVPNYDGYIERFGRINDEFSNAANEAIQNSDTALRNAR